MSDCPEKEALVACAYEECEAAERERVERHLRSCAACAAELDGFTALRGMLREWAPPDARLGFRVVACNYDATTGLSPIYGHGALDLGAALDASTF